MKKWFFSLLIALLFVMAFGGMAAAEESDAWKTQPVITSLYEIEAGKFFVEWEGAANYYQVYLDGEKAEAKIQNKNTIISVSPGTHQINIVPFKSEPNDVDASFRLEVSKFGAASVDLGSLGKDTIYGMPSETLRFEYSSNAFLDAVPIIDGAMMDFSDRVVLVFADKYDSDIYRVYVKSGKDVTYVDFDTSDKEAAQLIEKDQSTVSITLDQDYMKKHECMRPELDKEYTFSIKLRKWPVDKISGTKEKNSILESKESKGFDFTPFEAWKYAPEITYHSQTADGQVTLQWEHDDNGLGCQYKIVKLDKVLMVTKGQAILGTTSDKEYVVDDLMNGTYTFVVVPVLDAEEGNASAGITEEVKNDWVIAPVLACELKKQNEIELAWKTAPGVEYYHVTVSTGSGSVLRLVNLDFKKYEEFDVPAGDKSEIAYNYTYKGDTDTENGTRLQFEIYGVRTAADGTEQVSAATSQIIVLK